MDRRSSRYLAASCDANSSRRYLGGDLAREQPELIHVPVQRLDPLLHRVKHRIEHRAMRFGPRPGTLFDQPWHRARKFVGKERERIGAEGLAVTVADGLLHFCPKRRIWRVDRTEMVRHRQILAPKKGRMLASGRETGSRGKRPAYTHRLAVSRLLGTEVHYSCFTGASRRTFSIDQTGGSASVGGPSEIRTNLA